MPEYFASIGEAIGSAMRHNARMAADLATAQHLADQPAPVSPVPARGLAEPAEWTDGHPLMETIAAAVRERCHTEGTSTVRDDPRNIAAAATAAVRQHSDVQPDPDDAAICEALHVLLARVQRHALVEGEGPLLRQHVEHVLADRDRLAARVATLEHVAAGNKRHVQIIAPELEQAEAALARVRAECDAIDSERDGLEVEEFGDGMADAAARIRAALDGPTDTTPEA